jgi:putative oxidoreductase
MDLGLLIIRATVGMIVAAHGAQKLAGWFGGGGLRGTANQFEMLGFRPGAVLATMAGLAETIGGIAFLAGIATPFAASLLLAVMFVAIRSAHLGRGLFADNGGFEYPLTISAVAAALAFSGPGAFSLDHVLGLALSGPKWAGIAFVLAFSGALPPLLARIPPDARSAAGRAPGIRHPA